MSKEITFEDVSGEPVSGGTYHGHLVRRHQNDRRHPREHVQPRDTRKDASTADASGQAVGLKQRTFA
jgi:hypothetical protein